MAPLLRLAVGLWLEVRVIPVLMWSYSAVTLGTAVAWRDGPPWVAGYLAAIAVGVLLQGLVAHCANDLADWRSGTDRDPAPRMLSGGSGVIAAGLLTPAELRAIGLGAAALAAAIGLLMALAAGWPVLLFGAAGLAGAVLYSLPPVRAAYRPVAGEVVAFACVWGCTAGAYLLARGAVSGEAALAGAAYAAACVAMLLMHHVLDRGPDSRALPPKRTTLVRFPAAGRRLAAAWGALAAGLALLLAVVAHPAYLALAGALLVALAAHLGLRADDPASVTRAEIVVIACSIAGALATAAILTPALVWALIPPALLVPAELRLSGLARRAALARREHLGLAPGAPAPEPGGP
ncbi:MAG: prenyltransferase [Thermoleophilia bacterium]|jgi:1,4-dihydroxy-2-naphthoate octaprenyltransferase|nr:prenyltransferase [Thermoleophilia bacterium]